MERRFQKVKQKRPAPPTSCPAQKSVPNPKMTKVWSCHIPLESPLKGDFKRPKIFCLICLIHSALPKNLSWAQK